jgi:hypothetical protein
MLTKRITVLLEQSMWDLLDSLAKSKHTSISELVRQAVRITYGNEIQRVTKS